MNDDAQFNLIDKPWIPVLRSNGHFERVGIRTALTEAGWIRQIAASNPMDNVALLRFLLAVLHWHKRVLTDEERKQLDDGSGIPPDWLTEEFGAKDMPNEVFSLLGEGKRFYQGNDTPQNDRPIGDLLVEFPTETKIAHFRHVRDKEYGLCPGCCAIGIVRFCAWANAYGGGRYTSAVNGPTPAYAIVQDSTLLRTFLLHWPAQEALSRPAPWISADPPREDDLDIVTVFAWRSRRLWLGNPEDEDRCSYCGEKHKLIRRHAFSGNWKPPFRVSGEGKKFWSQDLHLILVDKARPGEDDTEASEADSETSTRRRRKGTTGAAKQTTLGFPLPGSKVAAHARFWRRALSARLTQSNATEGETASVTATGPAANKGLYQDAASLCLPRECPREAIELVDKAVESLSDVLRFTTPNPQRQHPERKAALDALSPSLEACLRRDLNACQELRGLTERLQPVVRNVVSATTAGSPLRRLEAMKRAERALNEALRKLASKSEGDSAADQSSQARSEDSTKTKRRRHKAKRAEG